LKCANVWFCLVQSFTLHVIFDILCPSVVCMFTFG